MAQESASSPRLKVGPFLFPDRYDLPQRPQGATLAVLDSFRQTQFLLGSDLPLLQRAMNLQLRIVADSEKRRTHPTAALLGLWSRTFAYLADACLLLHRGGYASCPPLIRAACDAIAAQRSLLAGDLDEYLQWAAAAVRQNRDHAALEIALGRYRAGSVLAQDPRLGAIYRVVTDLSMPHFGATVLQVAPETSLQRMSVAFADNAFHLGWAELIMGWLLALADAQLETPIRIGAAADVFRVSDEAKSEYERLSQEIEAALANPRRCRVEEVEGGRYLFHNFCRTSSNAPKKMLL